MIPLALLLASCTLAADDAPAVKEPYFGIHVVDAKTGRGVPLVELKTVNDIVFWTDSGGWVAFHEPELMDREVFFQVSSPGYSIPADGFGMRGVRLMTKAGTSGVLKLERTNIAERLYRVTGQGIHRDAALLGVPAPQDLSNIPGAIVGQDSVQCVPYRGKLFWLWGDTNVPRYPLGNFQTTAATSPLPGPDIFRPTEGVPLTYFTDSEKPDRLRRMMPLSEPGPVWLFGLVNVLDGDGKETLIAHYSRRKDLKTQLEQGLARFDDEAGIFRREKTLDLAETWRFPLGNTVRVKEEGGDYFYFCQPYAQTRVKADLASVFDPARYEAFAFDAERGDYRWQSAARPTTAAEEAELVRSGKLGASKARSTVRKAAGGSVAMHRASIQWNEHRRRWVMIGNASGDRGAASYLGEVWYAEAEHVTGPWHNGVQIATHPQTSFYNPRQHPEFAEQNGRIIYFEGTFTRTFSGNGPPVPRYEYNQLMYRLDLDALRMR
jgi:hypothetical protein